MSDEIWVIVHQGRLIKAFENPDEGRRELEISIANQKCQLGQHWKTDHIAEEWDLKRIPFLRVKIPELVSK